MLRTVTTALDVLGLLLVAAGAAAGAWLLVGPAALAVAGLVVLVGSWLAVRQVPKPSVDAAGVERPAAPNPGVPSVRPLRSRRRA